MSFVATEPSETTRCQSDVAAVPPSAEPKHAASDAPDGSPAQTSETSRSSPFFETVPTVVNASPVVERRKPMSSGSSKRNHLDGSDWLPVTPFVFHWRA